jgi:hypothetical protein
VKRFQTALFVMAGVALALVGMLIGAIVVGTDDHTDEPAGPMGYSLSRDATAESGQQRAGLVVRVEQVDRHRSRDAPVVSSGNARHVGPPLPAEGVLPA